MFSVLLSTSESIIDSGNPILTEPDPGRVELMLFFFVAGWVQVKMNLNVSVLGRVLNLSGRDRVELNFQKNGIYFSNDKTIYLILIRVCVFNFYIQKLKLILEIS